MQKVPNFKHELKTWSSELIFPMFRLSTKGMEI